MAGKIFKIVFCGGKVELEKCICLIICYLILFLPLFGIFAPEFISIKKILLHLFCLQGFIARAGIQGLGHFWFVSIIMVCYLITPVLQYFTRKYRLIFILALIGAYVIYVSYFIFALPYITWMMVYCLAYSLAALWKSIPKSLYFIFAGLFILLLYFSSWNDVLRDSLMGIWLHAIGGCFIFLLLYFLFSTTCLGIKKKGYFLWLDKYSFEIYLTHHVFIFRPFSLLSLTIYPVVNVLVIIVLTFGTAWVLKRFADKILLLIR